jgi:hypothetical protein
MSCGSSCIASLSPRWAVALAILSANIATLDAEVTKFPTAIRFTPPPEGYIFRRPIDAAPDPRRHLASVRPPVQRVIRSSMIRPIRRSNGSGTCLRELFAFIPMTVALRYKPLV